MSINRGMYKEDTVRMYNGILLSPKRKEMLPFAETWMDLETVKWKEGVRKRKTNIYINAYMWNLEKWYR